jgi:hypothetical protein
MTRHRRSQRRPSRKINKSRKTRKINKSKKSRKIRQRAGQGFTTTETTNPIAYREDEYDQMINDLNYNPSKQ